MDSVKHSPVALPILAGLQASPVRCSAFAVLFVRRPLPRF